MTWGSQYDVGPGHDECQSTSVADPDPDGSTSN
jgi:hypothetical protein